MNRIRNIFIIIFLLLTLSCSINSNTTTQNDYTYLYNNDHKLINPAFKIFHQNADSSTLFYHLNSDDVLYGKINGDSLLKARILVKYKVFEGKNKKVIVDSATIPLVNFGVNNGDKILQGRINFKAPYGKTYPLEVRFRDANKGLNVAYDLLLDKRENGNEQYFLLKEKDKILINPVLNGSLNIELIKSELLKSNQFSLAHSSQNFPMTPPPFATNSAKYFDIPIDASEEVSFENNRLQLDYYTQINRLQFKMGENVKEFYFYHYYAGFPEIVKVDHLTLPIRYISTSNEYKKVKNAVNYKKAIDDFWLKLGKNEEKAKEMIKEYYQRVEISNRHFTSYKEGWKTDRGIIYIVYGIPNTVYKTYNKETWIYGEENNILSVKFDFFKNDNILSSNDFRLIRNADYKSNWYRAVDMWRQAKIH